MILKASQRGGASQLGVHLLKPENEQVELHEIRGFMADDVNGAMKEAQAVALGTRCKQFLFSVSFNPPANENVPVDAFETAIERVEQANGLAGQPRIIIFHEKEGRRHAHAVWSRIDPETMTARPLPFFKIKLRDIAKQLYLEHGWQMPRGFANANERDPTNFTLAEWQQAKRAGRDPAALKAAVQECWAASDNATTFGRALEGKGLYLARGDRRAHVAVTYEGEVLSIARLTGKRTKEVAAKLGDPANARSVADTRAHVAAVFAPRLETLIMEASQAKRRDMAPLEAKRFTMRNAQRGERQKLDENQRLRGMAEAKVRNARLRSGVMGIWDRLTGHRRETVRLNESEAQQAAVRDRGERHGLVVDQLNTRRALQRDIIAVRGRYTDQVTELHRDLKAQRHHAGPKNEDGLRSTFRKAAATTLRRTEIGRASQGRSDKARSRGPDLGR